jgi:HK97 gp10 family phage protein
MGAVGSADISRLADALRESAGQSDITTQNVLIHSANYLKAEMEARVPVRTGKLKQSIQIRVAGKKVIIGPNTDYDNYVEFGTRPHKITAKPGKVLAFQANGRTVIVKSVNHPGTKAQPYVRPAFDAWVTSLGPAVAEANVQRIKK